MTKYKLSPFNLERALAGDLVVTRDEKHVVEKFHLIPDDFAKGMWFPLLAFFKNSSSITSFSKEGRHTPHKHSDLDLCMAEEIQDPIKYYFNVYRWQNDVWVSGYWSTEEDAKDAAIGDKDYIKTIEIEV